MRRQLGQMKWPLKEIKGFLGEEFDENDKQIILAFFKSADINFDLSIFML